MRTRSIIAVMSILALVAAACGGDTTTDSDAPAAAIHMTGEDPGAASQALIDKALGEGVTPSDSASWDIVRASIARAVQDLDDATIAKAMECWSNTECETGTGGELVMGYADGGGHVNVWRGVTHMEAILQALTYPEIGKIVSTEGLWDLDPATHQSQFDFLLQYPVDFIVGYPDFPEMVYEKIQAATDAGIPYVPFSGGWVGLPGVHDFALDPGNGYLTVVGEDLCALGQSFAEVLNEHVGDGKIGVLGGTTGNALTLGWQRCLIPAVQGTVVNSPADSNTTAGDTFWLNDVALQVVSGMLSADPDIAGFTYEYADGMNTALAAYDDLNIPFPDNLVMALRTDEQTLFCDWAERDVPGYRIFFSAGGNFQSRTAVTAAMMSLSGQAVPAQVVVPHIMREVTESDCNPNRVTPVVSGTSLVPDEVLQLMFGA